MSGVTDPLISPEQLRRMRGEVYENGPDADLRKLDAVIAENDGQLTSWSTGVADALSDRATEMGTAAYETYQSLAAESIVLDDEVRMGRIDPKEARQRLDMIRAQLLAQRQRRETFEEMTSRIETIDADPLAAGLEAARTNRGLWVKVPW